VIELIAFDGDDTLWHSESLFAVTHERFRDLLAPWIDADALAARLLEAERRNLALFGYGVKGFTLSMIETALEVSEHRLDAAAVARILDWGKAMLREPVELLDGVAETLAALARDHRLVLVTKGDLFHQESKVAGSGLGELFDRVAIVAEKDAGTYRRLAREAGIPPRHLLMVGNSVRSDVAPALEAGARAVHIPYHVTWALEVAEVPEGATAGSDHWRLDDIRQLPDLVARLQRGTVAATGEEDPR
jgi:putative hydrolase of the HAD superfamily